MLSGLSCKRSFLSWLNKALLMSLSQLSKGMHSCFLLLLLPLSCTFDWGSSYIPIFFDFPFYACISFFRRQLSKQRFRVKSIQVFVHEAPSLFSIRSQTEVSWLPGLVEGPERTTQALESKRRIKKMQRKQQAIWLSSPNETVFAELQREKKASLQNLDKQIDEDLAEMK